MGGTRSESVRGLNPGLRRDRCAIVRAAMGGTQSELACVPNSGLRWGGRATQGE